MVESAAIVVVNFASQALLEADLATLDHRVSGFEVIIVDNFFSETELAAVSALCIRRGWMLVPSQNVGFGSGVNLGVSAGLAMGCEVFVLLNPDARASVDALRRLADRAVAEPLTLACPTIVREDGSAWFSGGAVLVSEGRTTTRPGTTVASGNGWLTGACLSFSADLWRMIGGFDDDYFLYWEDVDLSWRVSAAGGTLEVLPDVTIVHAVGGTQGGEGKSPVYCFYNCRNRLLFASKHLSRAEQFRWLLTSVGYARSVVLRSGRRQFLRTPVALTWAATRGTMAGAGPMLRDILTRV